MGLSSESAKHHSSCVDLAISIASGLTTRGLWGAVVWYMTDVDENSGGTFCVPGSHRATNNPRGPEDGITVSAPIPGEMQCCAPAGSVYIQDSRCIHNHCFDQLTVVNSTP